MKKFIYFFCFMMLSTICSYGQLEVSTKNYSENDYTCAYTEWNTPSNYEGMVVLCKEGGVPSDGETLYSDLFVNNNNYSADKDYGFCKMTIYAANRPSTSYGFSPTKAAYYIPHIQVTFSPYLSNYNYAIMHSANKHIYIVKLDNGECTKVADLGKYKSVLSITSQETSSVELIASNIAGGTTKMNFNIGSLDKLTAISVKVDEITLNETGVTINKGASTQLTATVLPENAENKDLQWTSSDENIASVVNGLVTGNKAGMAIITAKSTDDGSIMAQCVVVVQEATNVSSAKIVNKIEGIYTIDGKKVTMMNQGIYIIRMEDGTTKEILYK